MLYYNFKMLIKSFKMLFFRENAPRALPGYYTEGVNENSRVLKKFALYVIKKHCTHYISIEYRLDSLECNVLDVVKKWNFQIIC